MSERTQLGKWHYTDGKSVFNYEVGTTEILGADPSTFVVLKDRYARDARRAYYRNEAIAGSDGSTFKALGHGYAADHAQVYFDGQRIDEARPGQRVRKWFLVTATAVVHAGKPIEGIDPRTFVTLSAPFARDATHVLFHRAERTSYGACHATAMMIEGAEADSFEVLGTFARDRAHVWFAGFDGVSALEGADPRAFRVLAGEHCEFGLDDRRVWSGKDALEGASPASFVVLEGSFGFAKDDSQVFYHQACLPNADVATFEAFPASAWGRDARAIYFAANVVEGIDAASFEVLDWNEARDHQNVFYDGERDRPARPQDRPRKAHLARLKKR